MKRLLVGCGTVGALGLACVAAVVLVFFFILPRRVVAKYDRFVQSHPAGTSVEALVTDPFVRDATMVTLDGELFRDGDVKSGLDELRAQVSARPNGELHIMWTHTPPFGRVNVTVKFSSGSVASVRQGSLD